MRKAYDCVEWPFLKNIMLRMEFQAEWVSLIMRFISTVTYSVNVNDTMGRFFHPSCGLHQGDPFSPLLFLFCSEGISSLFRLAAANGILKGAKASRRGPAISPLLFADDSIVFREANVRGATLSKNILVEYESWSGQSVNYHKNHFIF